MEEKKINLENNQNNNLIHLEKAELAQINICSNQIETAKNDPNYIESRNPNQNEMNLENNCIGKVKEMTKKFINRRQNLNNEISIQSQTSEKFKDPEKITENDVCGIPEELKYKLEIKGNNMNDKNEENENKSESKQKSFFHKNNSSMNENIVNEINEILKIEDYNSNNNFGSTLKTNENPSLALPSSNGKNNEVFETVNKEIYDIADSSNKKDGFKSIEISNIGIKGAEPYHDIIKENPSLSNDLGLFGQAEPVEFGLSPEPKSVNEIQNLESDNNRIIENLNENNTPEKGKTGRFDNARFMEAFTNCFVKFYTEMMSSNGIEIETNQNSNNKSNLNDNSKIKLETYRDEGNINKSGNTKSVSSLVSSGRKKNPSNNKVNIKDYEKNEYKRKINNDRDKLSTQDINLLFKHRMTNLKTMKNMKNMQNSNPNLREAQILKKNYEISKLLSETTKRDKSNSTKEKRKNAPNHPNIFPLKDHEAKKKWYGENSHNNNKNSAYPSSLCLNVNKQFVKELSAINHEINSSMDHPSVPRFKVPKLELVYKLASLKVQASPLNSGDNAHSNDKQNLEKSQKLKFN